MKRIKIDRLLYVYLVAFYFIWGLLGLDLTKLTDIKEGLYLLQNSNLFVLKLVRQYLGQPQDWFALLWFALKEVSIPYLFILYHGIQKEAFFYWSTLWFPLVIFNLFLLILNVNSFGQGVFYIHLLGYFTMVFSILLMLLVLIKWHIIESNE